MTNNNIDTNTKASFLNRLATLLAPMDDAILRAARAGSDPWATPRVNQPREKCAAPSVRPMSFMKI